MRLLVFILILVNLMFFAWTQGLLGSAADPDALRMSQQLQADRVSVVGRDDPPGEPAAAKAVKTEKRDTDACVQLSELPLADLGRVENLVKEKGAGFRVERGETAAAGSYWVFIPPLPSKAEAERKAGELKRLKVPEFFVIQEPVAYRFAISLGLFSSREAAEARLEELRGKGVRSAKVGEREGKPTLGWLEISGVEASVDSVRQSATAWAPNARVGTCKVSRTAAP